MKRYLIATLFLIGTCFGQNSFFSDRAVALNPMSNSLVPLSYGQVRVCTSQTAISPCPNLATVFDAVTGGQLTVGPSDFGQVTTDFLGRFSFQATPGNYFLQVAGAASNTPQISYTVSLGTTNVTGAQLVGGNNIFTGPNSFTNSLSLTNAGVFTNTQMNEYFQSLLNGINPSTEFPALQVGQAATDAAAFGVTCAAGTVWQCDGVASYVLCSSTTINCVSSYSQIRSGINAAKIWGANPVVQFSHTGVQAHIIEADANNFSGVDATEAQALIQDGVRIVSAGSNKMRYALNCTTIGGAYMWQDCFVANGYNTYGLRFFNGAPGSTAIKITPPDDGATVEIAGRNAADNTNRWFIHDDGSALFPNITVNWITSSAANPAQSGSFRFASGDCLGWRNNANSGDILLCKNASEQFVFGGAGITTPAIVVSTTGLVTVGTTVVASLPSAAANPGAMIRVSDSTSVAAEGQTCVGSSTNNALAFSNGTVWKCF